MFNAYIITILSVSLLAVLVYGRDKLNSETKVGARAPEILLIVLSAIGGVLGTVLAMIVFNHKSNMSHKWYFFFAMVVSILIQLFVGAMCLTGM